MSFKRPLPVSPSPKYLNYEKTLKQSKTSTKSGLCQVCGDEASIINYGTLSCQSCKTFFRRNGFHSKSIRPCLFNTSCEVNMGTRRDCTACRLAKCLSVGMSSDLIRKEEQKYRKVSSTPKSNPTLLAVSKQVTFGPEVLPLNQLHKDQFLSNAEWILLSNNIYVYNTFSPIQQICRIIEALSILPVEIPFDETNTFEIVALMYKSMQSFIRSSPDFQILTASELHSLFERNLHATTMLSSAFVLRESTIINKYKYIDIFTILCGSEILLQMNPFNNQLDLDSTSLQLILIVLAFSSNCFIVDVHENMLNDSLLYGTHRLLGSQNVYIELLWKYMIYRHDYYNSALYFSRLIELFLKLIKYSAITYMNNETYHKLIYNVLQNTKQLLMSDQNEQIPLWRKT